MDYKRMIIELLGKVQSEYTLKRVYKLLEYLYIREESEMGEIKMKVVVENEEKNMGTKIPVSIREEVAVPARKINVKIQEDAPLKPQKQSKLFIKNMNEYEARLFEAKQELYKFKKRYSAFPELKKIFDAIDEIEE